MRTLPFSKLDKTVSTRPQGYTEHPKTIGEHLLKYRVENGLKRITVARKIGVAPSVIADWETGRYQPYHTNMKKIICFIGYNPLEDL